ncbi:50S ribosomal protein L29, partial [Candidatus Woesearchaeota archaeon RBG_13_36_6]
MSSRVKEFGAMKEAQLNEKLSELRMELIKHNAQIATGTTPKSPGLIRQIKRNIAR